jgi:hypothetical protein
MGLKLRPRDYARLGQLMIQRGVWRGRRLLADAYVTAATTSSPSNPGYGWFWWVNAGTRFIGPTIEGRAAFSRRFVESAPPDMYSAAGFGDQLVLVIPSLDLVLTRSNGDNPRQRGDNPTGRPEFKHELLRRLMRAVTDKSMPDPGPFQAKGPIEPPDPGYGIRHSATEARHLAAARRTPPLPPAGPAVARAVLIGGAALHPAPLELAVGRDGRVSIALSCPPVSRSACRGTATLAGSKVDFRIGRGRTERLRLDAGGAQSATLRVSSVAKAGRTTSQAQVRLVRR